jgi:glutathione synthase/RimK-type ligase-like ATP-grasp enzyme
VDFGFSNGHIEEAFASREWMEVLRSLPGLLRELPWINAVANQARAGYKPLQLALAREVGLAYPETIITNSSTAILKGFDLGTPLVYKTLSSFIRPPDEIVFTNEVTREQIQNAEAEIAMAPCIFQRKLRKRHEVRVTIVGNRVFSIGIDSQSASVTEVDWRRDQGRAMYFRTELSREAKRSLLAFQRKMGLVFATYDFIITPEGEEVFLECNPGGQWLWLEEALGLDISSCLASALAEGLTAEK